MLRIKLNLFLAPCRKSRIFGTICSLQLMSKFGHFLPVFCPYLEFSAWLSLAMSATLKYIVDMHPPLESREPRNIVLSKFCSEIDRKYDVCLITCVSGTLDHIHCLKYQFCCLDLILRTFQTWWNTRPTLSFFLISVLHIAQNAHQCSWCALKTRNSCVF